MAFNKEDFSATTRTQQNNDLTVSRTSNERSVKAVTVRWRER